MSRNKIEKNALPKVSKPRIRQKVVSKQTLNEARAVVASRGVSTGGERDIMDSETPALSDAREDSEEEVDGPEEEDGDISMTSPAPPLPSNGDQEEPDTEPTFGDLLRTTLDPITVAHPSTPPSNALSTTHSAGLPLAQSLGLTLSQALRTTDTALLETCLRTTDLPTIRLTIQRLPSPLASTLLSALATRLHRRPGRAGSLITWIQWTLVAHGGYLAQDREVIGKLAGLERVVDERARGLGGLLMLKGKLDMLESQGALRRAMTSRARESSVSSRDSVDEEERVVYVEGQADSSDEEADIEMTHGNAEVDVDEEEEEEEEDMPNTRHSIDDDEEEDDDESEGGLIDDEAEESADETDDEELVDHDDVDEVQSSDSDGEPARPAKLQKRPSMFSKVR